jgi:hypothetical protein
MIIFEEFGGGQAGRTRNVPVFSDHSMESSALLALAKDRTTEGTKEVSPSHSGKRLSRSTLAAPSSATMRDRIAASLRGPRVADHGPRLTPDRTVVLRHGSRIANRGSRPPASFLTETGLQTEFAVTPTKQKIGEFLTGTRIAHFASRTVQRDAPPRLTTIREISSANTLPFTPAALSVALPGNDRFRARSAVVAAVGGTIQCANPSERDQFLEE